MIKLKGWFGPYLALAIRLAWMLLLYGILRLGFYGSNMAQFPQVSFSELMYMMAGGVKFDIVALLYINILYILLVSFPVPCKYNPVFAKIS